MWERGSFEIGGLKCARLGPLHLNIRLYYFNIFSNTSTCCKMLMAFQPHFWVIWNLKAIVELVVTPETETDLT